MAAPIPTPVRRHGNRGGYGGAQILISEVLERVVQEARNREWNIEEVTRQADYPVWVLSKAASSPALNPWRIYISAGIHGDEPAGTLAALQLIEANEWPPDTEIIMFPCLNPVGMAGNRREGPEGIDFNRDYRTPKTALVKAHREWLRGQSDFDIALLLHEDWEADGFYLYELCAPPARSAADKIVSAVSGVCPILKAGHADTWPAINGVVRPTARRARREGCPEALYLFLGKVDLCYTFEAPSDYDLSTRLAALVEAARTAINQMRGSDSSVDPKGERA